MKCDTHCVMNTVHIISAYIILLCTRTCISDGSSALFKLSVSGHRLTDNVISAHNSLSVLECSLFCLQKFPHCKSINSKGANHRSVCQLNNDTKSTFPHNLVPDQVYNYYEPIQQETEEKEEMENTDIVFDSCLQVLEKYSSAQNGVYRIKTDSMKKYSSVFCHMTSLPGCSGGGWTMVMKINGSKETFSYSSQYWINTETYSPEDGMTGLDDRETKLATFWNTPFQKLCVGMKIEKFLKFMPISYSAKSLYEIIADGNHRATNISRDTWKSLYVDSSLQKKCGKEGFNVAPERSGAAGVRLGILGNNEEDCFSADSFLGFGGVEASKRSYCNVRDKVNSCGNSAYCRTDNGDREVQAMGYIFVR